MDRIFTRDGKEEIIEIHSDENGCGVTTTDNLKDGWYCEYNSGGHHFVNGKCEFCGEDEQ